MLKPTIIFLIFLTVIISGCLEGAEETDPTGPGGDDSVGPDGLSEGSPAQKYWNFTIDNETVTAKITTNGDVNLTVDEDWWGSDDHVLGMAVFNHDFWMRTSYNQEVGVGVNDVFVGTGEHGWQGSARRFVEFDEPGEYWVAVFVEGRPAQVSITVENGSIEVMEDKTATVHYYDDRHEDWEKTYFTSPAGTAMKGSLQLTPTSEMMEIHSLVTYRYGSSKIELGEDVCEGEGLSLAARTTSDALFEVEAAGLFGLITRMIAVHWPFEGGEVGCW